MRCRTGRRSGRGGATLVETAIVMSVLLLLILGMLDLAIGTLQYNTVSLAARQGARLAIVHGENAEHLGDWGAEHSYSYTGTGASGDEIATALQPFLTSFDPTQVTIQIQWLDGSSEFEAPVRVSVSAPYTPLMTFIFGSPTITLTGISTMKIAH